MCCVRLHVWICVFRATDDTCRKFLYVVDEGSGRRRAYVRHTVFALLKEVCDHVSDTKRLSGLKTSSVTFIKAKDILFNVVLLGCWWSSFSTCDFAHKNRWVYITFSIASLGIGIGNRRSLLRRTVTAQINTVAGSMFNIGTWFAKSNNSKWKILRSWWYIYLAYAGSSIMFIVYVLSVRMCVCMGLCGCGCLCVLIGRAYLIVVNIVYYSFWYTLRYLIYKYSKTSSNKLKETYCKNSHFTQKNLKTEYKNNNLEM